MDDQVEGEQERTCSREAEERDRDTAQGVIADAANQLHYAAGLMERHEPRIGGHLRGVADRLGALVKHLRKRRRRG